jgi:hypothetical protein
MNTSVAIPRYNLPARQRPPPVVVTLVVLYAMTDPFMVFIEAFMDSFVGMRKEMRGDWTHDSRQYRKLWRNMGTWPSWGRAIMLRAKGGKLR